MCGAKTCLPERIGKKRRFTIKASARDGLHEAADEVGCFRRLEQHGALERAQLPRVQPASGAFAGDSPHHVGAEQILGRARRRVPVVALHRVVILADHRAVDVVTRTAIAARKAERVGIDEFRFAARHRRAFAVGDSRIDAQRRGLRLAPKLDRAFDGQVPRVVQVEVRPRLGEPRRIGKSRRVVLGCIPSDRERLVHSGANRLIREIRGAGVAAPLAHEHGDPDSLVPVVVDGLDFAVAHGDALTDGLRHLGFGSRRAASLGRGENGRRYAFEFRRSDGKMAFGGHAHRAARCMRLLVDVK